MPSKIVDPDLVFFNPNDTAWACPFRIGVEVVFLQDHQRNAHLIAEWDLQHRRWLIPGNHYVILGTIPGTDGVVIKNEVQQELIVSGMRFTLYQR